jgi:hypothetical protein
MSLTGILENVISDMVFIALAIIVAWLWIFFTQRRGLQAFFNVSDHKRLIVYLSNINVLAFGATGISGRKYSYQGNSVAYGEMEAATHVKSVFSFIIPKLAESSETIGRLFLSDVEVKLLVSPMNKNEIDSQAPFIALGSPAYNVASTIIEQTNLNTVRFSLGSMKLSELQDDSSSILPTVESSSDTNIYGASHLRTTHPPSGTASFPYDENEKSIDENAKYFVTEQPNSKASKNNSGTGESSSILVDGIPPITDTTFGFVERIKDPESNRSLFYVAGLSEFATTSAAYFLMSQWRNLYRKYKSDKSFIVMVRFDASDRKKWTVVFEREI